LKGEKNRYLDEISKSSHIKLVSTSPVNKANIKIKTNHDNLLNDVLNSYQLQKKKVKQYYKHCCVCLRILMFNISLYQIKSNQSLSMFWVQCS